MRVVVEARALSSQGGGVSTYASNLLQHLAALDGNDEYIVLVDAPSQRAGIAHQTVVVRRYGDVLLPFWLQVQVPRALATIAPEVVHFTKADVARRLSIPTVVTIFDIIPLLFAETQPLSRRLYWPAALRRAAALSDHIVTISETSKRDIVDRFGVPPERITVTLPAVDRHHFRPTDERLITEPYILFVGTRDRRKNVSALVRCFASIADAIPHRLVVAGKQALKADGAESEVQRLGIEGRVTFMDYVPYRSLPVLYSGADLLAWPSGYEGWGFPPQEAMACGTPVVVSDGGALAEVVTGAGEVVPFAVRDLKQRTYDTDFEQRFAAELLAILRDESRRTAMRAAGLARTQQFSWDNVARQTRQVYQQVCEK